MIDGSIKRNRNFGFELQSSCVSEKRFNQQLKVNAGEKLFSLAAAPRESE